MPPDGYDAVKVEESPRNSQVIRSRSNREISVRLTQAIFFASALLSTTVCVAQDEIRDAVVKIHTTRRPPDFVRP